MFSRAEVRRWCGAGEAGQLVVRVQRGWMKVAHAVVSGRAVRSSRKACQRSELVEVNPGRSSPRRTGELQSGGERASVRPDRLSQRAWKAEKEADSQRRHRLVELQGVDHGGRCEGTTNEREGSEGLQIRRGVEDERKGPVPVRDDDAAPRSRRRESDGRRVSVR